MADNSTHDTQTWRGLYVDPFAMAGSTTLNNLGYNVSASSVQEYSWDVFMGANAGIPGDPNSLDPFSGFDIPFWFEQDQHWDFLR